MELKGWSSGTDTSSWFCPKNRWITLLGLPYHLRTFEVLGSICSRFGSLKDVIEGGCAFDNISGVKSSCGNVMFGVCLSSCLL